MIYVVDVDHISLAFAARNEKHAVQIVGSRSFARAIGRPCPDRPGSQTSRHCPRAATVRERAVFHDMSAEFAETLADILVARVG